jgi:hypothetical protein
MQEAAKGFRRLKAYQRNAIDALRQRLTVQHFGLG